MMVDDDLEDSRPTFGVSGVVPEHTLLPMGLDSWPVRIDIPSVVFVAGRWQFGPVNQA